MLRSCKEVDLYIRSVLPMSARCQITFEPSPHSCHEAATVKPHVESNPSAFSSQTFSLLAGDPAAKTEIFTMSGHEGTQVFTSGFLLTSRRHLWESIHELPANIWAESVPPLCSSHCPCSPPNNQNTRGLTIRLSKS